MCTHTSNMPYRHTHTKSILEKSFVCLKDTIQRHGGIKGRMDEWFKVDIMPVRTQGCWPTHTHTHTFHTIWARITFQKLSKANFWAGHQIAVKSPSLTNMWEKANKDHVYVTKENSSFLSFHLLFFFYSCAHVRISSQEHIFGHAVWARFI